MTRPCPLTRRLSRSLALLLLLATVAAADPRVELMNSVTVLRRDRDFSIAAARLRSWIGGHPDDGDARLLLGQVLADGGDEEAALRAWTKLLEGRSVDVQRYQTVATRLLGMGRIDEAINLLRRGTERIDGADPFAWQRAELLLSDGDWPAAVEAHRSFLRQEPHRRPLVENRLAVIARDDALSAVATRGRGIRYREALQAAHAGARGAERTTLTLLLAGCALETGDPKLGLQTLRDAIDDGEILQMLYQYASRCEAAGHVAIAAEAYGSFASAAQNSPYHANALLKQAEMLAQAGDVDGAVALYRSLSSGGGNESAEAVFRVALLQAQILNDPAAALQTLDIIEPRAARGDLRRRLLALRAECRLHLDELAAAAADWQLLRAEPGGREQAEFGLAELAFFAAHFDSTAALVDSLVTREPTHPLANDGLEMLLLIDEYSSHPEALTVFARARLHDRQQRTEAARNDRAWLQQEAPSGLRHLSLLEAASHLEKTAPAQALALYLQVGADQPQERYAVSAALGQARMLEAQGQADAALRTYESAVLSAPLDPRTPEIRRHITRLRTLLGGMG